MRFLSSLSSLYSSSSSSSSSSVSFPTRAIVFHFSHYSTPSRRYEEESQNVRVSVWWDFENCNIPAGTNVFKVAHLITAAVRANGIKGPVQITAFGDVLQLARTKQEALSSTGVNLTHIPNGGKNSADRSLLVDLMYWVSQNPPPAHVFLISGDRDFASILHRLRMNNYNVLLASTESAPGVLCSAASIMWHWHSLIRGENLVGRQFNQPPDSPYGSWYGHYEGPLEDPFSVIEQPSSLRAEEVYEGPPKPRPIPKTVIRQIHNILKLYPKGLLISELRSELGNSCVSVDKEFYGYRKFSRFLLSMPHILTLRTNSNGQYIVHNVTPRRFKEPFESSRGTSGNSTEEEDPNLIATSNNNGSSTESTCVSALLSDAQDRSLKVKPSSKVVKPIGEAMEEESSKCLVSEPRVVEDSKQTSKFEADSNMTPSIGQHSSAKTTLFSRIWRRLLGNNDTDSENRSPVHQVSNSPDSKSSKLQKTLIVASAYDDKFSSNRGLFGNIKNWFKFWGKKTENGEVSEHHCEQNQLKNQSGKHHLFSSNSFGQDMQSFMESPKGVEIISQSKTRSEIAQNLLEGGPPALKSLSTTDLFDFLELLISEKKWVEEFPSETNPFKPTLSNAKKTSCTEPLHRTNGLTSLFTNEKSQCRSQGSRGHDSDSDKKIENISQATTLTESKVPERTRNEILGDCQKLVDEIFRDHPGGFNMGPFRKLFLEKYGYHLDLQKLGYPKLASLLAIIPGVTIASAYIIPTSKAPKVSKLETALLSDSEKNMSDVVPNSDNESSDISRKDDDFESMWEELGPACTDHSSENRAESALNSETTEKKQQVYYEPVLPEDESTETDGESCPAAIEVPAKQRTIEEASSLMQILDSWYSSKEDVKKDNTENSNETIDCSKNTLMLSSSLVPTSEANTGSVTRKQRRHQKCYSFVTDTDENDKGMLINDILGTLKKSKVSDT